MAIALITGAARGIGFATARRLAADGATVIVASRKPGPAAEQLAAEGADAAALEVDVTDPASVRTAAKAVEAEHGHLDVLVNNAGILPEATAGATAEAVSLDLFRHTFDTNLFGAVAVLESFLPLLRASRSGRIVNVSSVMGSLTEQADPESPFAAMAVPAHRASKAALNSVTIAVANQLRDTPIIVSSVCPGFVQTDLTPANREQAPLSPADAAEVVHRAATLPDGSPSGTFFGADGVLPW